MTFRRIVILLILATLFPLLLLSAGLGILGFREEQAAMQLQAEDQVKELSGLLEHEFAAQIQMLQVLAQSAALDNPPDEKAFLELARRVLRQQPLWYRVSLSDPDGNRLVDAPDWIDGRPGRVVALDEQRRVVESGQPLVGNIGFGRDRAGIGLRAPVVRDGKVKYVLTAIVLPEAIRDLLLAERLPARWLGGIVDGSGRVVARTTGRQSRIGLPASEDARAAVQRAPAGFYEGLDLDGEAMVSAYRVLPSGWSIHVSIPTALYNAPIARSVWVTALGGVLSITIASVFLWLFTREMQLRRRELGAQEQARRMEALGRMTGSVAHDFNNLLLVILGNLELVRARLHGSANVERFLEAIGRAGERGAQLTQQLLSFSRGASADDQQVQLIDVAAQIAGLLTMIHQSLRGNIRLETEIARDLPRVAIDPVQFDLALLNVAVNARDAMPNGGVLRLVAKPGTLPDGSARHGIALAISDTGDGVPEDVLPHVFEPFFTTKEPGKGTGLGLSQVYGFAKRSGGFVAIDSSVKRGTTVTLHLPAAREETSKAAERTPDRIAAQRPADNRAAFRVLLVDDNGEVRKITADYLAVDGFTVEQADDAEQALTTLDKAAFDIVVTDIVMPGAMDGLALARELRQRDPDMPVIIVSGYSTLMAEAEHDGFKVLEKPYRMAELAAVLDAALRAPSALGRSSR